MNLSYLSWCYSVEVKIVGSGDRQTEAPVLALTLPRHVTLGCSLRSLGSLTGHMEIKIVLLHGANVRIKEKQCT